jgi:hypothetical protein
MKKNEIPLEQNYNPLHKITMNALNFEVTT